MRQIGFPVTPTRITGRHRSIFRGSSPTARMVLGVLVLCPLAVSLYLVPIITALGLVAIGLGLPLLIVAWCRPEYGLLTLIFLTSSFIQADLIDLRLPVGGGLDLRDLALLGMLGLLGLRGLVRKTLPIPWWPVGTLLLVFLGFVAFSAVYAVFFQGVESNWAFRDLRALSFFAVYFVTAWALAERRQLTILLAGLFVLADLTAGVLFLQQFLGAKHRLLPAMSASDWQINQGAASGEFGAVRIVPPGLVLMHFLMVIAACLMVFARHNRRLRTIYALQFVLLSVGLLLTYTRAQWIAAAIALGLIVIVLAPIYRAQLARYLIKGVPVLVLVCVLFGTGLQESIGSLHFVNALATRASSIFTPSETLESSSLEWRVFETEQALRSISEHPLLGVGLGNSYRDVTLMRGEARGNYSGGLAPEQLLRFTRYIHSSYLSIPVKMGLPTLICFLCFSVVFLVKSWQLYENLSERQLKGIVLAVIAGFVGLLVWSTIHSNFVESSSTAVVGLMAGLLANIQYLHSHGLTLSPIHNHPALRLADGE